MWLFVVIKYLLLPNSDTYSHTHRQGAPMCACPSPDQLPKHYLSFALLSQSGTDCPRLCKGPGTAPVPHSCCCTPSSALLCITGFHVSCANGPNRIRATLSQLEKLLASSLDARSKAPSSVQKAQPRVCFLCSGPEEGLGWKVLALQGLHEPLWLPSKGGWSLLTLHSPWKTELA